MNVEFGSHATNVYVNLLLSVVTVLTVYTYVYMYAVADALLYAIVYGIPTPQQ